MKGIYILLIILFSASLSIAQSFQLFSPEGADISNGTYTVEGEADSMIYAYVHVKNANMFSNKDVKVRRWELSLVEGSINSFCWGSCFAPFISVSPDPITIPYNTTNEIDFSGDYEPNGNTGTTTVIYTFFDANNEGDSVSVTVHFDVPLGLQAYNLNRNSVSSPFPNPASDRVDFSYHINDGSKGQLSICNILGAEVARHNLLHSGTLNVNTSGFKEGVYFYSFIVDGKTVEANRLMIKR